MPFDTAPEIDLSSVGLITDAPAHSLNEAAWNDCMNIRCKDGSIQGVNKFNDVGFPLFNSGTNITDGEAMAVTQFTKAGSNELVIAYIVKGVDLKGHTVLYNVDTGLYDDVTSAVTNSEFTFSDNYPPQIFMFNELLIINPANDAPPQWVDPLVTNGSLSILPEWPVDSELSPLVARVVRPFGNRLMAMNILEERGGLADVILPIDILWSSHITTIGSLDAAEWSASTTNTAGDAFATDTPGKIIDGGQLGAFFIAYKSDSVIRVTETGDNLILSFETIFEDDGVYSSACFASIGDAQHLVIGNYGVYIHDGQSQKKDVAKGLFQDKMFELVNPDFKDKSFCFVQTRDKEVWFCLPTKANTLGSGCDLAFVYNYTDMKLHIRSVPNLNNMFEVEFKGALEIYGAKSGNSKLVTLSNSELIPDGWFKKEEASYGDNVAIKQMTSIYIKAEDNLKVAIDPKIHLGEVKTYTDLPTFNPTLTNKVDVRASGRYLNIRVTMDGDKNPKMTTIQYRIRKSGIR